MHILMQYMFKSNRNIVYSNKYHVVWCPKYRRKVLVGDVEIRLKEIIRDVCVDLEAELLEIECDKDHVHLLVEVDPQFGIHRLTTVRQWGVVADFGR